MLDVYQLQNNAIHMFFYKFQRRIKQVNVIVKGIDDKLPQIICYKIFPSDTAMTKKVHTLTT